VIKTDFYQTERTCCQAQSSLRYTTTNCDSLKAYHNLF